MTKDFFSISQTAKIVDMTAETLRHYDRIDLVRPCKTDEWTGYRYYSQQEIVRLHTIRALRCMGLPLSEIKVILEYDDFNKIIQALKKAEKSADKKITELEYSKAKIQRARTFYEKKLNGNQAQENLYMKECPERIILLSETMTEPTLDHLWNYHRHFYHQLPKELKNKFSFEDSAGIYIQNDQSNLFAVCTRYVQTDRIKILPQGKYLCADCTEENRQSITENLVETVKKNYQITPEFTVHVIVLTGILQWKYEVQLFIAP